MTSDVKDLVQFYANLPSIFENTSSSDAITNIIHNEKTYQPIFGSFMFTNSEPFTKAAFVINSTSSTNNIETNNSNPSIQLEQPLTSIEDISLTKKNLDNDSDDNIELFLNDFKDDHQSDLTTIPSLLKDIPNIDDLNVHEDEDNDQMLNNHTDIFDQSDSIRSSSPDSLLSSSQLNEDDDDDDVTQWNDDFILRKTNSQNDRPNAPIPPPLIALNFDSHEQVDFIDSSRSNSRCSNDSLHLSIGYNDQAKIFIHDNSDDHEMFSSSSDSNHDEIFNRQSIEDIALQINLDYHRSRSSSDYSSNQNYHSHRSSPIPNQSPILDIDQDTNEIKPLPSAPIALLDDDDDDDDGDDDSALEIFMPDEPVLSNISWENLFQLKNRLQQNEIIHDIINMRHILDEYNNNDDFLAVMHNPSIFEEVLYDNYIQQVKFFSRIIIQ